MIEVQPHSVMFSKSGNGRPSVAFCVSLYNYQDYIVETLESVYRQTVEQFDLIVVDDCSRDQSVSVAKIWLEQNQHRFNTVYLVKHLINRGPGVARNTAFKLIETPYVFILDADNLLYPRCVARCLEAIETSGAAFAYPIIEKFGNSSGLMSNVVWNSQRIAEGNRIDVMGLIQKSAVMDVGGYSDMRLGWEDYDLWCKFVEKGYYGVLVPEILARYRVHQASLLRTITNTSASQERLVNEMIHKHPWLKVKSAS